MENEIERKKALQIIICFSLIDKVYTGKKIILFILFVSFYLYINEIYYEEILTSN